MYPLILCSVMLIAIAIERFITLRRASVDGDELLDKVKELYNANGDSVEVISQCEKAGGPIGRVFARGLKNAHREPDRIEMAMEQEAANEQPSLEANLPIIKTIVNISPLLGLLGTIAGMISAFRVASQAGL